MAAIVSTLPPSPGRAREFRRDSERLVSSAEKNSLRPEMARRFFEKYGADPDPEIRGRAPSILGACAAICRRNGSLKLSADISCLMGDRDVAALMYLKAQWFERALEIYVELAEGAARHPDYEQYLFMAKGCARMYSMAYPEVDMQRLLAKHGLYKKPEEKMEGG